MSSNVSLIFVWNNGGLSHSIMWVNFCNSRRSLLPFPNPECRSPSGSFLFLLAHLSLQILCFAQQVISYIFRGFCIILRDWSEEKFIIRTGSLAVVSWCLFFRCRWTCKYLKKPYIFHWAGLSILTLELCMCNNYFQITVNLCCRKVMLAVCSLLLTLVVNFITAYGINLVDYGVECMYV